MICQYQLIVLVGNETFLKYEALAGDFWIFFFVKNAEIIQLIL
jgi:hypothetical protein